MDLAAWLWMHAKHVSSPSLSCRVQATHPCLQGHLSKADRHHLILMFTWQPSTALVICRRRL